jgi:anti-sigma factor RsiW
MGVSRMTEHLSLAILSALADGELSTTQLVTVNEHIAQCPSCTSSALEQALMKTAAAKAGQRYTPPPDLQARLAGLMKQERETAARIPPQAKATPRGASRWGTLGWGVAFALLLLSVGVGLWQRSALMSSQLVGEVCDQHIATLAANTPPQVLSSDRHTVKPWFQGKLPYSFNLPENLPADTTLDGANLTYLHNRPVAQLLYSLGKHRVSVFVQQRSSTIPVKWLGRERSGFHVDGFVTDDLEALVVSDADPARLSDLTNRIRMAQTK